MGSITRIKGFLHKVVSNDLTGKLVRRVFGNRIPDLRWKGYSFAMPDGIVNQLYSSVFWGFYESAEIRLVERFLRNDLNVIELGGSSGVVSSHIVRKLDQSCNFIVAEMNTDLITILKTNIENHNLNGCNVRVLNNAVSYTGEYIYLQTSNNSTETSILGNASEMGEKKIFAVRLSELVKLISGKDYALVSDIEGAEAELFIEESDALSNCSQLIIELHQTEYKGQLFTVTDLRDLIVFKHDFSLVQQDGFVYYFTKINNSA
jgi:FkbM family methyltransferase